MHPKKFRVINGLSEFTMDIDVQCTADELAQLMNWLSGDDVCVIEVKEPETRFHRRDVL